MKNLVIFSAEELYELIHDNPVVDKNSDTIYMSTDCYENGGYKKEISLSSLKNEFYKSVKKIKDTVLSDLTDKGNIYKSGLSFQNSFWLTYSLYLPFIFINFDEE